MALVDEARETLLQCLRDEDVFGALEALGTIKLAGGSFPVPSLPTDFWFAANGLLATYDALDIDAAAGALSQCCVAVRTVGADIGPAVEALAVYDSYSLMVEAARWLGLETVYVEIESSLEAFSDILEEELGRTPELAERHCIRQAWKAPKYRYS
jgi:hypothetical protein